MGDDEATPPENAGICNRIVMGGSHKLIDDLAIVVDGSGYYAAIICREDFGCVLWEALA